MTDIQNPAMLPYPSIYGLQRFRPDILAGVKPRFENTDMGNIRAEGTFPDTEITSETLQSSDNPFHTGYRDIMRNLIIGRMRNNRLKMMNVNTGGNRNLVPKPQPAGTFQRPFVASGNGYYGQMPSIFFSDPKVDGGGGSFRSRVGSKLGREILKKRGEQLSQMALLQEQVGMESGLDALPDTGLRELAEQPQQPVPLPREQAGEVALDLIFNAINENVAEGQFDEIRTDDLRKVMNNLAGKVGLSLQMSDLVRYYEIMNDVIRTVNAFFADPERITSFRQVSARARTRGREEGELEPTFDLTRPKAVLLNKIREILKVLIDTFNLQPRDRSLAVRQQAREIIRRKEDPLVPSSIMTLYGLEEPITRTGDVPRRPIEQSLERASLMERRELQRQQRQLEQRARARAIMEQPDQPAHMFGEERELGRDDPFGEEEVVERARQPARLRQERMATLEPEQQAEISRQGERIARASRRRTQEAREGEQREARQQLAKATRIARARQAEDIQAERPTTERLEALRRRGRELAERSEQLTERARQARARAESQMGRVQGLLEEEPEVAPERPQRITQGYVQSGQTRGRGRPRKYSSQEDFVESRRLSAQVQRKKKAEYKKAYDKAIAEGLGGMDLNERALELFMDAGFKPSRVFNFGLVSAEPTADEMD